MTTAAGFLVLATTVALLGFAAFKVKRRFFSDVEGPLAVLVTLVIALQAFIVVSLAVGVFGWFEPLIVLAVSAMVAGGAWRLDQRAGDRSASPSTAPLLGRWDRLVMVVTVVLVGAPWLARTIEAVAGGVGTIDSLWYHLPTAARFAQTGSIDDLHFVDSGALTVFYPQNTTLLHAHAMDALGTDIASTLIGMGWLAMALLAAWCIGQPWGVGTLSMAGTAVVLSTPIQVSTQPGGAYNDVAVAAFVLSALAVFVRGRGAEPIPWSDHFLMATSVGLALGSKWTVLVAVAVVTMVGVTIAAPRRWPATAVCWAAGLALTGSFWMVRNLLTVGNPFPPLDLRFGSVGFDAIEGAAQSNNRTIAEFVLDATAWRENFIPGFGRAFGLSWPLFLLMVAIGIAFALLRGDRVIRSLAVIAAAVIVGYVVSPQLLGFFDRPTEFEFNLRYPTVGLALALIVLPIALAARGRVRTARQVGIVYIVLLVATQFDPSVWPLGLGSNPFDTPPSVAKSVLAVLVAVGLGAAYLAWGRRMESAIGRARSADQRVSASTVAAVSVGTVAVVALMIAVIVPRYDERRFTTSTAYAAPSAPIELYGWAKDIEDARIGVAGDFFQFPYTGDTLSNHVQFVVEIGPNGAPIGAFNCESWRSALNAGDYDYIVVSANPVNLNVLPEMAWTADDVATTRILGDERSSVFSVDAPLAPEDCRPA